MKHKLIIISSALILIGGCTKDEQTVSPSETYKKYNGRYELINSTSNVPVDLNGDQQTSINLLDEIQDLHSAQLTIAIIDPNTLHPSGVQLFNQLWPEQYPLDEQGGGVNYAIQGVTLKGTIDESKGTVDLEPDSQTVSTPRRFTLPETVLLRGNESIEITTQKELYTSFGWKTVVITSTYKRIVNHT